MAGSWSRYPSFPPTDNLWSVYTDKGVFVEKTGTPSVPVPEESRTSRLPYVLTDIMTYFTMLVGIYFPSVTGEASGIPGGLELSPPSLRANSQRCPPPRAPFSFVFGSRNERNLLPACSEWGAQEVGGLRELCFMLSGRPMLLEVTL